MGTWSDMRREFEAEGFVRRLTSDAIRVLKLAADENQGAPWLRARGVDAFGVGWTRDESDDLVCDLFVAPRAGFDRGPQDVRLSPEEQRALGLQGAWPVELRHRRPFRALADFRIGPLTAGRHIAVERTRGTGLGGTLGAHVWDDRGRRYLLGNRHVLCTRQQMLKDRARRHAAGDDDSPQAPPVAVCHGASDHRVARLSRGVPLVAAASIQEALGGPKNLVDAALARVPPIAAPPREGEAFYQLRHEADLAVSKTVERGTAVRYRGAGSGQREGLWVSHIGAAFWVPNLRALFVGQVVLSGGRPSDGDSGSVAVEASGNDRRAVGLVFAGTAGADRTGEVIGTAGADRTSEVIVNPMRHVVQRLGIVPALLV